MIENYYNKDTIIGTIYNPHPNIEEINVKLRKNFTWVRQDTYTEDIILSSHNILEEPELITVILPNITAIPLFGKAMFLTRKFCISTKTSFIKTYDLLKTRPSWMPDFCNPLFIGTNHEEFNRPYPQLANTFSDYYFSGDADQIEKYFDLPTNRGTYDTYYGATVVNNEPVRVKQYVFNNANNSIADWDVMYFLLNKKEQAQ
jgi:hypothetical protein